MPPPKTLLRYAVALLVGLGLGWLLFSDGEDPEPGDATTESDEYGYAVSHIVIPVTKERSEARARVLARQAREQIVRTGDFAVVARARSEDSSAPDGGFLGFVRVDFDTNFAGAVQALRPGELSQPLRTHIGWQVIKRHTFEEGRRLEEKLWIPTHGVFIPWEGLQGGKPGVTKEQAKVTASMVLTALTSGSMTLTEAARQFTAGENQRTEAYIGMTAKRGGATLIYDALEGTVPGALIGPIEHPNGWAIVMRGRYLRSLCRHVLIQHIGSDDRELSLTRTPQEALAMAKKALAEVLADRSKWDKVVERDSDERYSRANRGTIGVLDPGKLPDGFQGVIYDMKPGEIHPRVVESSLGYHILWKVN